MLSVVTVANKSLNDWEPIFKTRIEEFLKEDRLPSIVHELTDAQRGDMGMVYKRKGENRVDSNDKGKTILFAPLGVTSINPTRIRLDNPIKVWLRDPSVNLDFLFRGLSREIAEWETRIVLDSLKAAGKMFKVKKDRVTWAMLSESYNWISKNIHHPDTLLVHPSIEATLMETREFVPFWMFSRDVRTAKRDHFSGLLGPTEVYWTPFIDPNTLLLYEKMMVRARKSGLKVAFGPTYQNPKNFEVWEDYLSWVVDDTAVSQVVME